MEIVALGLNLSSCSCCGISLRLRSNIRGGNLLAHYVPFYVVGFSLFSRNPKHFYLFVFIVSSYRILALWRNMVQRVCDVRRISMFFVDNTHVFHQFGSLFRYTKPVKDEAQYDNENGRTPDSVSMALIHGSIQFHNSIRYVFSLIRTLHSSS